MLRISYNKIKAKRLGIDSISPVSMRFLRSWAEVKTRSASDIEQEKAREPTLINTRLIDKFATSSALSKKKQMYFDTTIYRHLAQ